MTATPARRAEDKSPATCVPASPLARQREPSPLSTAQHHFSILSSPVPDVSFLAHWFLYGLNSFTITPIHHRPFRASDSPRYCPVAVDCPVMVARSSHCAVVVSLVSIAFLLNVVCKELLDVCVLVWDLAARPTAVRLLLLPRNVARLLCTL